jgi:hypothetical protein
MRCATASSLVRAPARIAGASATRVPRAGAALRRLGGGARRGVVPANAMGMSEEEAWQKRQEDAAAAGVAPVSGEWCVAGYPTSRSYPVGGVRNDRRLSPSLKLSSGVSTRVLTVPVHVHSPRLSPHAAPANPTHLTPRTACVAGERQLCGWAQRAPALTAELGGMQALDAQLG